MSYEVTIVARFDTREQAEQARSDMEEVVGKNNGDLEENTISSDEDEYVNAGVGIFDGDGAVEYCDNCKTRIHEGECECSRPGSIWKG